MYTINKSDSQKSSVILLTNKTPTFPYWKTHSNICNFARHYLNRLFNFNPSKELI